MNQRVLGALALATFFVSTAPAAAQSIEAEPQPPAGWAANQIVPERDAQGKYLTPNVGLSKEATLWHVRAALNVAALGCRSEADKEVVAQYNKLLTTQRRPLAAALLAVKAQYRARYGARAVSVNDREMTKLYNFFAQSPAQQQFCEVARGVLSEAQTLAPAKLSDFAVSALPRLEAPFTDFYVRYDAYRTALAAWRSRSEALASVDLTSPTELAPATAAVVADSTAAPAAGLSPN